MKKVELIVVCFSGWTILKNRKLEVLLSLSFFHKEV